MATTFISTDNLLYYHAGIKRLFAEIATTLSGYGITDAYTKTEVDNAITSAVSGISQISFSVVSQLPSTGSASIIYLVPNSGSAQNIYDEYIYINSAWEKIGTTDVDLSGYWSKTALTAATDSQIDTILAS